METYVELHARSAFSFLRGASLPEELAGVGAELCMPAMALLDRDGFYGAPRFHLAAQKLGLRAHIGAEITLQDGSVLPLLVANRAGYQNLCRLITDVKLRSPKHPKQYSEFRKGMAFAMPQNGRKQGALAPEVGSRYAERGGPSAAKAAVSKAPFGTVETVPLQDTESGSGKKQKQVLRFAQNDSEREWRGNDISEDWHGKPEAVAGLQAGYETGVDACRYLNAFASPNELAAHAEGLIALTGSGEGPLASALAEGFEQAVERVGQLTRIFGKKNVYVELQRHFHRQQEAQNQAAIAIAERLGLPLLATNGVCYARPEEREILDVFTCIRNKVRLDTAGRLLARNSQQHLKPAAEMAQIFADLPQAIGNTAGLSARLQFTLADLGYQFPDYPVPPGETMNSFLRQRTLEGARARYGDLLECPRAWQQIERELALIEKLNLAGYFLIVWDIVRFCREQGILVQGRGSAANSAVCYSLGITAVDAVGMELLFERFLSEERGEWPDIDLDLPSGGRRERAIQYVYERYGKRGAAMTANVITYRGRSAAREIGKALDFDEGTISRLAGLVRAWEWRDPKDTPERQFREAGLDLSDPRIRKFFDLYLAVQDLPRHLGQHSGGMVLCQGRLDSVVPLEPATMPGRVVVQWDKDDCADMGMIKVDLLGLGMMAALEDSLTLIRGAQGEEVDLAHLPPDDPAVYAALQQADTIGLFQVESRAQQSCLPRLRPKTFYDIVVQVGIVRPGPIVGNMVHPYLKRRQGQEPPECAHPSLEPVLRRTLGVPLFQEQLLRMAMIAAGFSGGQAEELRRAFTHKRSEKRMKEIEVQLRRGMEQNGITGKAQDQIVQSITSFAEYGFPESHAASFALLAYASAYLKCHYLAAFAAALLNNQPMGFYHPSTIIKDAQRHGLRFKPIDVSCSEWLCTLENGGSSEVRQPRSIQNAELTVATTALHPSTGSALTVRLGLLYAKGLREEEAHAILRERAKQPFASVEELARRVPQLRKDEMVRLAEIGALNSLKAISPASQRDSASPARAPAQRGMHRRAALWQAESAIRPAGPLLDAVGGDDPLCPLLPMNYAERVEADFRGTGLTLGQHLLALRRAELDQQGVARAKDLPSLPNGRRVRVAGNVIVRQRPGTAKGFVFLSLEDETGIANAIITPDLFERCRVMLVSEPVLLIEGVLQNLENVVSVKATRVMPLESSGPVPEAHNFR